MIFAILKHESATSTHMSPYPECPSHLLPTYPSGLSQSASFGYPASCTKLALVTYLTNGNVHVSVVFSQIIPPPPSLPESKSLFFTFVSPWLSCI